MKYNIYSLKDTKVKAFAQPFYSLDNNSAVEACRHFVLDDNCPIKKHLEDYHLYIVGEFDDFIGKIIPLENPTHIVPLSQLIEVESEVIENKE